MYQTFCLFAATILSACWLPSWVVEVSKPHEAHSFALADLSDQVNFLPGLGRVQELQVAGYLPVSANEDLSKDANVFYWFVAASTENTAHTPLVLWLNGGPGSSGFYGFFAENGPYHIKNDITLTPRASAWCKKCHYLIIEQAPGIGYSYAPPNFHLKDSAQASDMLFYALKAFYKKYPELSQNPLYIAGESYAGTSIPQLATRIVNAKLGQAPFMIDLRGILIGDGWINPSVQLSSNADFAYFHGLIDIATRDQIQKEYLKCAEAIRAQTPSSRHANVLCNGLQKLIAAKSGVTAANIRKSKEHDYSPITHYLNQQTVKSALHIDPRVKNVALFSEAISDDLEIGLQDSVAALYPPLLTKGIRVLIYNGLDDGKDCNFIGTDKWLAELEWSGKEKLKHAPTHIWRNKKDEIAGYVREAEGLTQVKIRGAGHLAPMDQPENVQEMVYRFIFQEPF